MSQAATQPTNVNHKKPSRWLLKGLLSLALLILVLVIGLWFWSGSSGSLATALSIGQRYLKDGQTLDVSNVQGSIRHGGHIGTLRWEQNNLRAELSDVEVKWQLMPLLSGKLVVDDLNVREVRILPKKASEPVEASLPTEPFADTKIPASSPEKIILPIEVDLQKFQIASVHLGDKHDSEVLSGLNGRYLFDKAAHELTIDAVHVADGDYQGFVKLTAVEPFLDADLKGTLLTLVPESDKKVKLNVAAKAQGHLNRLNVDAQAQAVEGESQTQPQANLKAVVMPWAGGMILPQADLDLRSFNLNAFWPQAPVTLLSGTTGVTVSTDAASGQQRLTLTLAVDNALHGRISQKKLPFSSLNGKFVGQGNTITVQNFNAQTGKGSISATGSVTMAQGKASSAVDAWSVNASLKQVDPSLFTDKLASDAWSGTIKANQAHVNSIAFDANLTMAQAANIARFRIKSVNAQGHFENQNRIRLNTFNVKSLDATVSGGVTTYVMDSGAVSGPVKLVAPGFVVTATLDNFAEKSGSAKVSMDLNSAELAYNWIKRQPQMKAEQLLQLLEKLKGVTERVDNVAHLTQAIPISVTGGWGAPTIKAEVDAQALVKAIVESKAKDKLIPALDKLEKSGKINETEKKLLKEAGGKLGDFMKKKTNK